mgnify:FL=1
MNIIITGATKGIGRAIAVHFAKNGFNIAACARSEADLQALKTTLTELNSSISVYTQVCDVSIKSDVEQFGNFCKSVFKTIDVLVNNAGVFIPGNVHDEPEGTLEQLIQTNLYSAYYLTRAIVPEMKLKQSGHIFNICSVASINPYDGGGSYAISKFALYGFSQNLRHELKDHKIRVTAVLPGAVLTESWKGTDLPESRFIDVEDVASLIYNAWAVSKRTVVEEILIRPMEGDI